MKKGVYPMQEDQIDQQRRLIEQTYYIYKHKDSPLEWDSKTFKNLEKSIGIIIDFSIKNDLQNMNHEIRTPLNAIPGFGQLAKFSAGNDK